MARRPRLRDKTSHALEEIQEREEYGSMDEAISYLLREEGFDV